MFVSVCVWLWLCMSATQIRDMRIRELLEWCDKNNITLSTSGAFEIIRNHADITWIGITSRLAGEYATKIIKILQIRAQQKIGGKE